MNRKRLSLIIKIEGLLFFIGGFGFSILNNENFLFPYICGMGCTLALFSKEISGYAFLGADE